MKRYTSLLLIILTLLLTACANNSGETTDNESLSEQEQAQETRTVTIKDSSGEIEVKVNPKRIISLDNRTFETLDAWGVELVAAPKTLIPSHISYSSNENIIDVGNHREPNLELIAAANPDLVIVGQRFSSYYDEIKSLVPSADVINLNIDVSEEVEDTGSALVTGFENVTTDLGKIFEKETEAQELIDQLHASIDNAKASYNTDESVMSLIISGGNIGYSAPGHGRVWGPVYNILGLTHALDVEDSTTNHMGDEISIESIAATNPDWLLVLDRDASVNSEEESPSAKDVLENSQALSNTKAVIDGNIIYAPADTYTNESIQTYIEIFDIIAENFSK